MIVATLFFLHYLVKLKPFKGKLDHFLNIGSVLFLLILYSFCACFAILKGEEYSQIRDYLGFGFIGIALLLFLVNVFAIIIFNIFNCASNYRKKKERKKYL